MIIFARMGRFIHKIKYFRKFIVVFIFNLLYTIYQWRRFLMAGPGDRRCADGIQGRRCGK